MSLILDALRKLDREKSSRRSETANISSEILRPDLPRVGRRMPLYLVAIIVTAVFTAAVTYVVMTRVAPWSKSPPSDAVISPGASRGPSPSPTETKTQPKSLSHSPVISPSPHEQVEPDTSQGPPLPKASVSARVNSPSPPQQDTSSPQEIVPVTKSLLPAPAVSTSQPQQITSTPQEIVPVTELSRSPSVTSTSSPRKVTPPSLGSEPVLGTQGEMGRMPRKLQDSTESSGSTPTPGEQKGSQNLISKEGKIVPGNANEPAKASQNGLGTAPPSLKITAIAWDEEPSKRLAFVNGIMTYEGGTVEGVKIVEIYPRRVRFLYNGQHFEIPIN